MIQIYYGPVINPQSLTEYLALPYCLVAVGADGNIIWIVNSVEPPAVAQVIRERGLTRGEYTFLDLSQSPGQFIMPGLVDTHIHACQFPNLGVGGDLELVKWLEHYTFPVEKKFVDNTYAERIYNNVVDRSIASGTTTSCYYATLHLEATKILADIVRGKGQRAFVGKCNMDHECPPDYKDPSPEISVEHTVMLINYIKRLQPSLANEPLVHPIITPRFALSCSEELLDSLGKCALEMPEVSIQTHISENRDEIRAVEKRFGMSYAEVYDKFHLLRENTILGHGVWLTDAEKKLIAKRKAGVSHCPTSNFYLSSGMAKVGSLLDHGIKVGLGTDVSGGYNPSVLYAIQMASTTSKMVFVQSQLREERCKQRRGHGRRRRPEKRNIETHDQSRTLLPESDSTSESESDQEVYDHRLCHDDPESRRHHRHHHHHHHNHRHRDHDSIINHQFTNKKLGVETLLYLATLGGANLCCLQDRIGSFAPGKAFDALHVSIDEACGNLAVWGVDGDERVANETNLKRWLERFLFGGDNRNVMRVFVQGAVIGGANQSVGN